jgi:hypothetical protein
MVTDTKGLFKREDIVRAVSGLRQTTILDLNTATKQALIKSSEGDESWTSWFKSSELFLTKHEALDDYREILASDISNRRQQIKAIQVDLDRLLLKQKHLLDL